MTAAGGVRAIAGAAAAAAAELEPLDEQLELLPPSRFAPGTVAHDEFVERVKRDRAGRPPGARNIATRNVVDFVRRVLGDPMIESARLALHTPQTLAAELECTKLEAARLLEDVRKDLRRYMYAPLAAVDGEGNAVPPTFQMVIGGRAAGGDGRVPWDYEGGPELEQNQALAPPAPAVSHDDVSHEGDK